MSYVELAYDIISRFVGPEDVSRNALKDILTRSFATFRTDGEAMNKIEMKINFKRAPN